MIAKWENDLAQRRPMTRKIALSSFCALLLVATSVVLGDGETPARLVPVLKINKDLDKRTVIKPSAIPKAGDGLYALVAIKKGEVIGELGGQLRTEEDYPAGNHYMATILECAWEETQPYKYLDAKHFGANVSRINFAPSKINGVDTHFQNAGIVRLCTYPYFVFVALRDIEPGSEIWSSYGPNYDYDRFMYAPVVRDFFCALAKLDCREKYGYEH
jgi:SET domain-containing protein